MSTCTSLNAVGLEVDALEEDNEAEAAPWSELRLARAAKVGSVVASKPSFSVECIAWISTYVVTKVF